VERPFQAAMPAFERPVFEFDSKTTPARQPSLPAESPLHTGLPKLLKWGYSIAISFRSAGTLRHHRRFPCLIASRIE